MENVARGEKARRIAHGYVGWSVGAGLIPFPLVDVGSLVVLQVKMLTEIAKVYEVPLERERARTLVMSAVGGLAPQGLALTGIPALLKFVPVLGTLLGVAVMPAAAAGSTLALADLFIRHIETYGRVPDRACAQLTHSPAEPVAAVVPPPAVVEPTASDLPPAPPPATPVADAAVDEPAAPPAATAGQAAAEEPGSAGPTVEPATVIETPSGTLQEGASVEEGSEPDEPDDATAVPDPASDTDAERPVRRRPAGARTRRRSPPTETS
ncbi:MAG TPA: DUF697 domain-containing protein [Rhodopila sp.]|nr:DUF697 domain-containing protein [Rhodopila sp.]